MSPSIRVPLLVCLTLGAAGTAAAQSTTLSPSPTLPSDTLEANFAPRSQAGPVPEISPTLPSDTLDATLRVDSFPTHPFEADTTGELRDDSTNAFPDDSGSARSEGSRSEGPPMPPYGQAAPSDSAALEQVRAWLERHPGMLAPPPARAVLVRA